MNKKWQQRMVATNYQSRDRKVKETVEEGFLPVSVDLHSSNSPNKITLKKLSSPKQINANNFLFSRLKSSTNQKNTSLIRTEKSQQEDSEEQSSIGFLVLRSKTEGDLLDIEIKKLRKKCAQSPQIMTSKSNHLKYQNPQFLKNSNSPPQAGVSTTQAKIEFRETKNNLFKFNMKKTWKEKRFIKYSSLDQNKNTQANNKYMIKSEQPTKKNITFKLNSINSKIFQAFSVNGSPKIKSPQNSKHRYPLEDSITKQIVKEEQLRQKKQIMNKSILRSRQFKNNFVLRNKKKSKRIVPIQNVDDIECCPWSDRAEDVDNMRASGLSRGTSQNEGSAIQQQRI